jgi:hypothetical protein
MRAPNRLFYMSSVLFFAILACQGTGNPGSSPTSSSNSGAASPTSSNPGLSPVSLPAVRLDQASDVNSADNATKRQVTAGDVFVQDLLERPFNANTMDTYFPYLDIVDTQGFKDKTWGYATITVEGNDSNGHLPGKYGVELDLKKDGRGDWLIVASAPSSTTWTTQGVQAWQDKDGDVGGIVPLVADNNLSTGDGYETLVFDQGKGSLTDGAWVRVDPNNSKTVQLAVKLSMLGSPASYALGSWAGTELDPAKFDYNDHMTHVQAGDPNRGYGVYPIKALAEIDNTCRLAIGFVPTGKEPGLCKNLVPVTGGALCKQPATCVVGAGCTWYGPPTCSCSCIK